MLSFRVYAFGGHFFTLIYHYDIPLCDMIFHLLPTIQWHLQEDHSTVAVFESSQFWMYDVCVKRTYSIEHMVEVPIDASHIFISIIFHRQPLPKNQHQEIIQKSKTYMILWQIFLPRPDIPGCNTIIRHVMTVLWQYKLTDLQFSVGDDTARDACITGSIEATIEDIFTPEANMLDEDVESKFAYHRSGSSISISCIFPSFTRIPYGSAVKPIPIMTIH